ncbi:hypothetical protein [Streptomyces sp. MBT53]|uniref:hypothetical protein n=1 Tax=Streptomyces sp. MBT53 TaxID=1488384 RepID=UPI0019144A27|nr:hypothetical protein [Streptomyces sp. MBT53]MBK6015523.1 hypothetical protein [Streptomyces sp. MBT53]
MASSYPLDLGRLAETMLYYRTVRLILTRHSVTQLVQQCGPDLALEIVSNTNIDAVFADRDLAVKNEGVGTAQERHRPVSIKVMSEPDDEMVVRLFREATGKSGKGRRMANRFIGQTRSHSLPSNLTDAAADDWQDDVFMRKAIIETVNAFAPGYTLPADLEARLVPQEDGYFMLKSNLDWTALREEYQAKSSADDLTPGHLLVSIVDMREDLYLGATFAAGIAQDSLGARLVQAKCADLAASVDAQQAKIDQFNEIVVRGLVDLRSAVNSGALPFGDFIRLLPDADKFRGWLDTHTPDADLVKSYAAEATKRRLLSSKPVKELRWLVPAAAGFALFLPNAEVTAPAAAATLAAIDRFVVSRFTEGWRPAIFIDTKLRPSLGRELGKGTSTTRGNTAPSE